MERGSHNDDSVTPKQKRPGSTEWRGLSLSLSSHLPTYGYRGYRPFKGGGPVRGHWAVPPTQPRSALAVLKRPPQRKADNDFGSPSPW